MRIRNTGNERAKKKFLKGITKKKNWLNFHVFTIKHNLAENMATKENGLSLHSFFLGVRFKRDFWYHIAHIKIWDMTT